MARVAICCACRQMLTQSEFKVDLLVCPNCELIFPKWLRDRAEVTMWIRYTGMWNDRGWQPMPRSSKYLYGLSNQEVNEVCRM